MKKLNTKSVFAAALAAMTMVLPCGSAYADSNASSTFESTTTEGVNVINNVIVVLPELVDNTLISVDLGEQELTEINADGTIVPYAPHEPKELWDWNKGIYGTAHNEDEGGMFYPIFRGSSTKTYYKFDTDTGKLTINLAVYPCYNYTNRREIQIKMYRAKKGFWSNLFGTNWEYFSFANMTFTPSGYTDSNEYFSYSVPFSGLSSDYDYYFEFCNNSHGLDDDKYYAFGGEFTIRK